MATREEYRAQPVEQRLQRLSRTPDDLAMAIQSRKENEQKRHRSPDLIPASAIA
jgi:hypothetical protein